MKVLVLIKRVNNQTDYPYQLNDAVMLDANTQAELYKAFDAWKMKRLKEIRKQINSYLNSERLTVEEQRHYKHLTQFKNEHIHIYQYLPENSNPLPMMKI